MVMQIVTYNQIVGFHYWKNAPEEFSYLKNNHRHVFKIRCWFNVTHSDREIEINDMENKIEEKIKDDFNYQFENFSCEDIARYCIETFDCESCEVLEDGFGGAYVRK